LIDLLNTTQRLQQKTETELPEPRLKVRQHLGVLGPILTVYLCLSLFRIEYQSLWLDEVLSVQNSAPGGSISSPTLWLRGQGPFYFVLLHLWDNLVAVPDEFSLRVLSVLLGGLALCITFLLGLRLFDRQTAGIASAFMATSPFFIWYSQEVRYVTLMMATSLLAMYCFWRATSSNRFSWWLAYGFGVILAVAAFVSNLLLAALQGAFLLCSPPHRALLKKWISSQAMFLVVFLFWANEGQVSRLDGYGKRILAEITARNDNVSSVDSSERLSTGGSKRFDLVMIPYTFFSFTAGFSAGPSLRELHSSQSLASLAPHARTIILLSTLFGCLFFYGLVVLWRRADTGVSLLLTFWLTIPVLGTMGISAVSKMSYNVRYVAMAFPAYLFILAIGVSGYQRLGVRVSLLAAIFSLNAVSLVNYYFNPIYSREDTRAAVRYIESAAGLRDVIVVAGNPTTLRYYYKGNLPVVVLERSAKRDPMILSRRLGEIGKGHERLWLVMIRPWEIDRSGRLVSALKQFRPADPPSQFPGVDVYGYRL
jgi:uncharacterized membrane protein